ncbi:MAG TPA: hypothetical protein VOA87_07425 [Thermoanaerobaculia bacterium]|nr:hypothetical protein [Thermoanaerobaculia bacterium]
MSVQSHATAVRRWPRFGLPAVLLGGMLVGGAVGAGATDGRLVFTKMEVEHCNGLSTCIWKVTCQLAKLPKSEIVKEVKAGTAASVDVNRTFVVHQFPVDVSCTAFRDTGWIRTAWESVGDATLAVPAGGDYVFDLGTADKDQVHIHLSVDSLEVAALPTAAGDAKAKPAKASEPRQFFGVFHPTAEGHAVIVGFPWDAFKARSDELAAKGVKLDRMVSFEEGGKRLWAGIFHSTADRVLVLAGLEWDPFVSQWNKLLKEGLRLNDFETYGDGKKRLFAGIFREGSGPNPLWVGQDRAAFLGKWNELAAEGLRLVDLEVYRVSKGIQYAGVFRTGSGGYGLWTALDWASLQAKAKALNGSELAQVQTYMDGRNRVYDAVLRGGGSGGELTPGLASAAFAAKWKELLDHGQRLADLETYPE